MQHSELEVIETKGGGGPQGGSAFTVFADQVSNAGQDDGKGRKGAPGAGKKLASRGAP
jgi:hypothetical protein